MSYSHARLYDHLVVRDVICNEKSVGKIKRYDISL